MKKILVIHTCLFLCVISCTIRQYHDEYKDDIIVNYHNFPYPKPLFIDTKNCLLIENEQLVATNCDTIHLRRLNRETEVVLTKRINEMYYEWEIRKGKVTQLDTIPLHVRIFFLYGKLDLQPDVKSLILLENKENEDIPDHSVSKSLWLINIKEDKLYSIVNLDSYSSFFTGIKVTWSDSTYIHTDLFPKILLYTDNLLPYKEEEDDLNRMHLIITEKGYVNALEKREWKSFVENIDNKHKNKFIENSK